MRKEEQGEQEQEQEGGGCEMELDWYSKKTSASHSFRSVASFTSFIGIVSKHPQLLSFSFL